MTAMQHERYGDAAMPSKAYTGDDLLQSKVAVGREYCQIIRRFRRKTGHQTS